MTKSIKLSVFFLAITILSSFTSIRSHEVAGIYGTSDADPSQIKLTLNFDNTFQYQDFSNPEKKIISEGKWTSKGNQVHLHPVNVDQHFHSEWKISEDGQVAKSRKGLSFYRLCKLSD